MIPRTDQYIVNADRSLNINGPNTQGDRIQLLYEALNDFMPVVELLPRGHSGEYIVRDPRAGKTGAVRVHWNKVHLAAGLVLNSTIVTDDIRETAPGIAFGMGGFRHADIGISDTAWALINAINLQQLETAIPGEVINRVKLLHQQVERLASPQYVGRLKDIQRELHRWVRETPGARHWITKQIVPQLVAMWEEQRSLRRRQEAAQSPVYERWRKARDTGKPFNERPPVIYDPEMDPCRMSAITIGRLRDDGQHELADLAEAYFIVMLHDAGEAGNLDKLCALLGAVEGMERPFDWAYLDRMATGLERNDTPPRHSPEAIEGMLARFKDRFSCGDIPEHTTGWTMIQIREAMGDVAPNTLKAILKAIGIKPSKSGNTQRRFGATTIWAIIEHCRSHRDSRRRSYVPGLMDLLGSS